MFTAITSALAGLNAASTRVAARSENITNLQTEGYRVGVPVQTATAAGPVVKVERAPPDKAQTKYPGTDLVASNVDLESEFTDIIASGIAYKASAKVFKTVSEMEQEALDIIA